MPCRLEPWEIEGEEKRSNKEKFGLDMNDNAVTTTVACAVLKSMSARQIKDLPLYVQRWWKQHQKDDKMQSQR